MTRGTGLGEGEMALGMSFDELQAEIDRRMDLMDEAQEEAEHLGQYGELMRMVALTAFNRAAELIELNNRRIERQLAAAGIELPKEPRERLRS